MTDLRELGSSARGPCVLPSPNLPVRENTDHPVALERHLGTNVSQLRTEEGK